MGKASRTPISPPGLSLQLLCRRPSHPFHDDHLGCLRLTELLPALQDAILDVLLQRVNLGAILSLEALLPLVVAFVRDLQQEAVAYLPPITAAMADLVDAGEPVSCGASPPFQSGLCGHPVFWDIDGL